SLLVLFALRSESGDARRDFLLGEYSVRSFGAAGFATCRAIRADTHNGGYPPALQRFAASCFANAESPAGSDDSAGALQHQPDGCADQAVLHDGGGKRGGTVGGRGNHGSSADDGCSNQSSICGFSVYAAGANQRAFFHCGNAQDHLRPVVVSRIYLAAAA